MDVRGTSTAFPNRQRLRWPFLLVGLGVVSFTCWSLLGSTLYGTGDFVIPRVAKEDIQGTIQSTREWSLEEQSLRRYRWLAPSIDPTLSKLLGTLTSTESSVRNWILETRPVSGAGVGIGLGAEEEGGVIRPADAFKPRHGYGPGAFEGGSFSKYSELLQEWYQGVQATPCEKGSWENTYTRLHSEIISGKKDPMLLEYSCPTDTGGKAFCGGFADRFLGITSTFLYAVLSGRAFSVSWENPFPFDLLFDSPNIDWSRRFAAQSELDTSVFADAEVKKGRLDITAFNGGANDVDRKWQSYFDSFKETTVKWIRIQLCNRGVVIRSFYYPKVAEELSRIGFRPNTVYTCLINYLIRPKRDVLRFITEYTSVFALPKIFSIGIQIRCGDSAMLSSESDRNNTVARYQAYFKCAEEVGTTYKLAGQKVVYYLVSDSAHLKAEALELHPDLVILTGMEAHHPEVEALYRAEGVDESISQAGDQLMTTVAESYIFAGTDFQILTEYSGFGKIPTFMRGKPGSTIQIGSPWGSTAPVPLVDCRGDNNLRNFHQMASGWSLG